MLAANAIPLVLFVLIGGVWADRLERHRVMIATDVVRAVLHGTLAVLIFIGDVPIWAIVVIEAGFGTAEAFFNPAVTGLVPQTVPEDELQQANAATSVVANAAELIGPAIATALVLGVGAGWAFAVDALTFVVSALLLARLHPRPRGERPPRQPMLADLRTGWHELRSRQWAWVVIAATSVALLVSLGPFFTLGPTVAEDLYGSTGIYGAIAVAMGAGTVLGSLVGLRWRPKHPIRFAMAWAALWPPAFALFALGPPLWTIVAAVRARRLRLLDVRRLVGHRDRGAHPAARDLARQLVRLDGVARPAPARVPARRRRPRRRSAPRRCWSWAGCWASGWRWRGWRCRGCGS